ncbi:hypothetical protein B23_1354 [Geobacillus thermoleovorans B23]|nr:hypothetical protein B23_1354 [Geobacillus thermoleovorans B23]
MNLCPDGGLRGGKRMIKPADFTGKGAKRTF